MKDIGTELRNERYESVEQIDEREKEIEEMFTKLWEKSKIKRPAYEKLVEREYPLIIIFYVLLSLFFFPFLYFLYFIYFKKKRIDERKDK